MERASRSCPSHLNCDSSALMVVDQKKHSYGTLSNSPSPQGTPTHSQKIRNQKPLSRILHKSPDTSEEIGTTGNYLSTSLVRTGAPAPSRRTAVDEMTQDVYQRQPLLGSKGEGWKIEGTLTQSDAPSVFYDSHQSPGGTTGRNGNAINGMASTSMASLAAAENGLIRIEVPPPHREEPKFPRENMKTILSFIFVLCNWFLTTVSLALVHERVPDRHVYGPLPDVFLDNVPASDWGLDVSEVLIILSTTSCMLVLFFHRHRFIILRRIFLLLGVLYMMRSITMYVTVLPVASKTYYCSEKSNHTSAAVIILRAVRLLIGMGLSINGQHVYCGDYIYSGHTVILTIAYLIVQEYTPRRFVLVHWSSWIVSVSGVIFVMIAHGHYTVDIIIAYYVTTRLFWIYHTMANNSVLKQKGPANYLARIWWFPLFMYFEGNVDGVVPRRYEWPLPWPKQLVAKYPDHDS